MVSLYWMVKFIGNPDYYFQSPCWINTFRSLQNFSNISQFNKKKTYYTIMNTLHLCPLTHISFPSSIWCKKFPCRRKHFNFHSKTPHLPLFEKENSLAEISISWQKLACERQNEIQLFFFSFLTNENKIKRYPVKRVEVFKYLCPFPL